MVEVDGMSVEIYLKFLNIFNKIMTCWFQSNQFLNLFDYMRQYRNQDIFNIKDCIQVLQLQGLL